MKKRLFTALLVTVISLLFALGLCACDSKPNASNTTVTLDSAKIELTEGETHTLTANVSNKDVALSWRSSDETVATVAGGTVTAVKEGKAIITVTTSDGAAATCEVTVKAPVAVTGITLNSEAITLTEGESHTLTASLSPENATNKSVTWASSSEQFATVADGVVTAVKEGKATITATTVDGEFTAECEITVKAPLPGSTKALAVECALDEEKTIKYGELNTYWLKFTAQSTGRLRVYAEGDSAYSQQNTVTLYDSDAHELGSDKANKVSLYAQVTQGELYYIELRTTLSSYDATVLLEMPEDGAYKEIAKTVEFDTADSFTLEAGKAFWYKFTVSEASIVEATLDEENADIRFYFDNAQDGATSMTYYTAGEYYVKVTNKGEQSASVSVAFSAQTIADIPDGAAKEKPFDIVATVAGISKANLPKNRDNWFKIAADKDRQVKIAVTNDNGQSHDYVWYDGDTATTEHFDPDSGLLTIRKDVKANGEYYLLFKAAQNNANTFTVTVSAIPDGTSKEEAIDVELSSSNAKEIAVKAGEYWLTFTPTSSIDAVIYSACESDVSAKLYARDVELTGVTDSDASNNIKLAVMLNRGTKYYLKVTTANGTPDFNVGIAKIGSSKDAAEAAQIGQSYSVTASAYAVYWFAVTPAEDTELKIAASEISTYSSVMINVFDYSQDLPRIGGGSSSYSSKIEFTVNLSANKTYHISFNGNCTVNLIAIKDGYAKDRPKTVAFDTADSITLTTGDKCWYKFTLSAPAEVTATVDGNPANAEVTFENKTVGEKSATYLAAGDYYVTVTNKGTESAIYSVTFAQRVLTEDDMPEGTVKSKAFAAAATYNAWESDTFADSTAYWFTFTLGDDKSVEITFVNKNNAYIIVDYIIYDNDGVSIADGNKVCDESSQTVTHNLIAGKYYLKLNRSAGIAPYAMQIKLKPDGSCLEGAISASIGKSYNVTAGEYWFKLSPSSATDTIIYSVGNNAVTGDLCWANGTSTNTEDKDAGNNFRIEKTLNANIIYYFKVTATDANPDFTVCFAVPGSSKEVAALAQVGQTYSGSVSSSADYWLRFSPTASGKIKISVSYSSGLNSCGATIVYTDGTEEKTAGYSSVTVTKEFTAGETYYLKVSAAPYYGTTTCTVKLEAVEDTSSGGENETLNIPATVNKTITSLPSYPFNNSFAASDTEVWIKLELESGPKIYVYAFDDNYDYIQPANITFTVCDATGKVVAKTASSSVVEATLSSGGEYYIKVSYSGTADYMVAVVLNDPLG